MSGVFGRVLWGFSLGMGICLLAAYSGIRSASDQIGHDIPFSVSIGQVAHWSLNCILLGLLWGFFYYRKNKKNGSIEGPNTWIIGLIFFAIVVIWAFLVTAITPPYH